MKKRKIFLGLVTAAATLGLAACKTDDPNPTPPNPPVEVTTYTVTFENNGHGEAPKEVKEVTKLPTLPTLEEEGWTFGGWYYDSALTKEAKAGEEITANTKLYAKWTKKEAPAPEKYTVRFDSQKGTEVSAKEVEKGKKVAKPEDPTREGYIFKGWYKEAGCTNAWNFDTDVVDKDLTLFAKWEAKPVVVVHKVYFHLTANDIVTPVEVEDGELVDVPQTPVDPYKEFTNWYTSPTTQNEDTVFGFSTPIDADIHLYAGWTQKYDTVNTPMVFADLYAAASAQGLLDASNKLNADATLGRFTFEKGTKLELAQVNTQAKYWSFELKGAGTNNSFTFSGEGGSTSGDSELVLYKLDSDGITWNRVRSLGLAPNKVVLSAEVNELEAGTYKITTSYSFKMNLFTLTEKLPQGPTTGIELSLSQVNKNFLLGRAFDYNGLSAQLVYENGRKDDIALANLNVSVEDFTTAGKKIVTVSYKLNDEITYTQEYEVNVCSVEEIVVYDFVLNSSRETQNLQKLFALNSTFNYENLVVKAKCLLPETTDQYIEFVLTAEEFTVTTPTLDTLGNKSVSVVYGRDETVVGNYDIEVVAVPDLSAATEVVVTVNPQAEINTADNYNLHTINDALQFLKLAGVADNATKTISLMKNTVYKEKVEITMPNIVLTTGNLDMSTEFDFTYENAKPLYDSLAVIEFDALNGLLDPSEKVSYSTDGSATVSVRPSAENFKAEFVTFKNTYNTAELYEEAKIVAGNGTQGVAALVQADKAIFARCYFTGYQDTLYAQIGRQYYDSCLIEGHTDYIFGFNATAYFENCLVRSIGAGATEDINTNYNNGGYILATKGLNKGDSDTIKYGFIFNGSQFIADDKTANGSVSIARGWDKNMSIMVMNSAIAGHISKEAYGEVTPEGKNMNDRYGKMNAEPNADLLLEYNNTGAGAISASLLNTCTVVTETVANEYKDLNLVFGATNGKVVYGSAWNPVQERDATVVLKNPNGSVFATLENIGFTGATISEDELKAAITVPENSTLEGFYKDADCTIKYDFTTVLAATNDIYIKLVDASLEKTIAYDFLNEAVNTGWTTTATDKTAIGNAIGVTGDKTAADYDSTKTANVHKLAPEVYLTSPKFDATTKAVTIEVVGGTLSSGSASAYMKIEALNEAGEVVDSIIATSPAGKKTGKFTYNGAETFKFESSSAFVQIRFTGAVPNKGYGILSCSMSYVADAGGAETPDPDAPVDHKNTLDWSAIATDKLTATGQYDLNAVDGTPLETPIAKFDGAALTTEVFAGTSNSFLSVVGGTVSYRDGQKFWDSNKNKASSNPSCIEVKGDALAVTFTGTGTLTISVSSTGSTNWSSIALKDAAGNYITPTYTANDNISVTDKAGVYAVKTTGSQAFTFTIEAAGTYTICTDTTAVVNTANCNRATRILNLVKIDRYVEA